MQLYNFFFLLINKLNESLFIYYFFLFSNLFLLIYKMEDPYIFCPSQRYFFSSVLGKFNGEFLLSLINFFDGPGESLKRNQRRYLNEERKNVNKKTHVYQKLKKKEKT